jgi:DNA repair protein RecO (recombination protein O)
MYYQIKGLVLSAHTQSEADKIAVIYCYQWGKVSLIFPGAKKINAKLSSAAEPLTESEFIVYQNHPNMRPKVTGANIINNNSLVKSDFNRNLFALYAAEISSKLAGYNIENKEKYILIARIWQVLGTCKNLRRALTAFVLRFLQLSGYSFSEYLFSNNASIDSLTQQQIIKLSKCSGEHLDNFDFNDERIWKFVENYLAGYIKKSSVGLFMEKLNDYELSQRAL